MKKITSLITAIVLAVALTTVAPALSGCKSPTVQQQAVKTLKSVHQTADAAFNAYLDLVVAGRLSTNSVPKVTAAYDQFQLVFGQAVNLVASNQNAAAPQSLLDSAAELSSTIATAKEQ